MTVYVVTLQLRDFVDRNEVHSVPMIRRVSLRSVESALFISAEDLKDLNLTFRCFQKALMPAIGLHWCSARFQPVRAGILNIRIEMSARVGSNHTALPEWHEEGR